MRIKTPPPLSSSEDELDSSSVMTWTMITELDLDFISDSGYNHNNGQPKPNADDHDDADVAYFNNSGKTPLPLSVQHAGQVALQQESKPWMIPSDTDTTAQVRQRFASLIHASSPDDIAIVPSTGFALTLAAHNLFRMSVDDRKAETTKKKKVLILQDEMSSEVYCWQEPFCHGNGNDNDDDNKADRTPMVEFVIVPHPQGFEGELQTTCTDTISHESHNSGWTELILDTLKQHSDVDVCCIPPVHWSDGSLIDLQIIGGYCQQHSIPLVVDATQSVGILNMNVQEIKCDFLAVSVHKWLLGPIGMSLVYIHPKHHETWLPLDQHDRSRVAFQNETFEAAEDNIRPGEGGGYPAAFIPGAARCDGGGKKNPILLPMVNEGLRIVCDDLDIPSAQEYLRRITNEVYERARVIGFGTQAGPRCGHIIGLRPQHPALRGWLTPGKMVDIAHNLSKRGVFIAVRSGAFRISPYINTTMDDVSKLIDALTEECNAPDGVV